MKQLGVVFYETFVIDGHTEYTGLDQYKITSKATYNVLQIASTSRIEQFKTQLAAHQQGKTDYKQFCLDCAQAGIEKWRVSLEKMTCTYLDVWGNDVLHEQIPE